MGSSKAPTITQPDPAASVVAAVAKDPETGDNAAEQEAVRTRKRGISATYQRYNSGNSSSGGTGGKGKLGE